jgi:cysteine-S-conjugate beta-lyase
MANPLEALPIEALRARRSVKWRRYDPDVLPLWVAEMDVALAEPIAEALLAAVARGDTGYADAGRLAEAFAGFAGRRYGWAPDPAGIVVVADALRGISEVLTVLTAPGDGVVVNTPAYPPFFTTITALGRRFVPSPLARAPDGSYRLDLDALDRDLAAAGVSAYLLCNPHNPTGLVLSPDELTAVADLAERHRVRLLADEIHGPLVYPGGRHTPLATIPRSAAAESLIFASASKAWNLPGLKAALVVAAGAPALPVVRQLPADVTWGTGLFGVLAGEAAFERGEPWLDELLLGLDQNRALLATMLAARLPGIGYVPPAATYLAWLDLRALGLGDDPADPLLTRARVALSRGLDFGPEGTGHARLNFATRPSILNEAVRRIASLGQLTGEDSEFPRPAHR